MEELKLAAKKVRESGKSVELDYCWVCWSVRLGKVVTIPKS